jgi:basic amino acid/polyamine antiporter, APA family
MAAKTGLSRRLGLWATTLAGVGAILGIGIYVLVGVAARQAGNALWLSFLIAAIVAAFTGISYARLSRLRQKNAPEFQYLGMAFGSMSAFLVGWLILWATVISLAAVAHGFAGYLEHAASVPHLAGAVGLVVLSSLVVFIGVGQSIILSGILTILAAAGLVLIVGIGIPSFGQVSLLEMPGGISGVVAAAPLVFFAYLGFESIANLAEEMKNPRRDLPRAILMALGISTVLYLLVSVSAVSVLGWQDLSQSSGPLAAVGSKLLGSRVDLLLSLIALASTGNNVLLLLFSSSRAMWAMSCAGALPMAFCVIGENRRTPWFAIIVVGAVAGAFVFFRSIEDIARYTNFATLLVFTAVNASALKIFAARKPAAQSTRFFADILLPVAGVLASLWLAITLGWQAALFGGILLATGVLAHFAFRRLRGQNAKESE